MAGAKHSSRILTRAIVRPPAPNFAEGLTTVDLGAPIYELAVKQHAAYCAALEECGLTVTYLEADPAYPDSTFVEDTAVLTDGGAMLTRPGAPSRLGEVRSIGEVVRNLVTASRIEMVQPPARSFQLPAPTEGLDKKSQSLEGKGLSSHPARPPGVFPDHGSRGLGSFL